LQCSQQHTSAAEHAVEWNVPRCSTERSTECSTEGSWFEPCSARTFFFFAPRWCGVMLQGPSPWCLAPTEPLRWLSGQGTDRGSEWIGVRSPPATKFFLLHFAFFLLLHAPFHFFLLLCLFLSLPERSLCLPSSLFLTFTQFHSLSTCLEDQTTLLRGGGCNSPLLSLLFFFTLPPFPY